MRELPTIHLPIQINSVAEHPLFDAVELALPRQTTGVLCNSPI